MKDLNQISEEYFSSLFDSLDKSNFMSCASISSDFIKFSEIIDFNDGVFIGEIFESVFMQITTEISKYQVTDEEINELKVGLNKSITIVSSIYNESDKNELYNILKEMRLITTKFQFKLRRQCKVRQAIPQFPLPFQVR
jgi:hypothetical protein